MNIWITGTRRVRIPVLPSSYEITSQENDTIVTVIGIGDVVLRGKRGLQEVTFSSFFPSRYDPGYCQTTNLRSPREYIDIIESMKRAGPVKLTISGVLTGRYRIIDFPHGEDSGNGDVQYSLTFREYRAPSVQQSSVTAASENDAELLMLLSDNQDAAEGGETRTTKDQEMKQQVLVKAGDCLSSIARRLTGTADWRSIYEKNKEQIGDNPNDITEGMWLNV